MAPAAFPVPAGFPVARAIRIGAGVNVLVIPGAAISAFPFTSHIPSNDVLMGIIPAEIQGIA
jgi:hypothetical protein